MAAQSWINFFREEVEKEHVEVLDLSYLTKKTDEWWLSEDQSLDAVILKTRLMCCFLSWIHLEHYKLFSELGYAKYHIAAISVRSIFSIDDPRLAWIVHEVFSELFGLIDVPYEYENHKTLYLRDKKLIYKDWGSGYGEITPHSDDLYENINVDYLSLTTCRDETKTPTQCYFPRDLLKGMSDDELGVLLSMKAKFRSGKNVNKIIERERNIISYDEKNGFRFFLDFRIDNDTGMRMVAKDLDHQCILDKMRLNLDACSHIESSSVTGNFLIVANFKVLHARGKMLLDKSYAASVAHEENLYTTPRLLFRSKGPRREIFSF